MSKIFISYRRDDSADITGRIYDRLVAEFGERNVFMDVTSIPYGTHYPLYIPKQIDKCEVFLAVIGRNWMQSVASTGGTRLDDPKDPVRIEVEVALKRPILVIPLLVSGASFPTADQLPATMQDLSYRHGSQVRSGADFDGDVKRLTKVLKRRVECRVNKWMDSSKVSKARARTVKEGTSLAPKEKPVTVLEKKSSHGPVRADRRGEQKRRPSVLRPKQSREGAPFEMVKVSKGAFLYGDDKVREEIDYDYWIDQYPVTNKKYAAFIAAGGYQIRRCWSKEGWKWKTEHKIAVPADWDDAESKRADHPVVGVSYYEAEAYAKWAGKRLPTERERW